MVMTTTFGTGAGGGATAPRRQAATDASPHTAAITATTRDHLLDILGAIRVDTFRRVLAPQNQRFPQTTERVAA